MTAAAWEETLARLLRAADPGAALDALRAVPGHDASIDAIDRDGLRVAARIVMGLRLDRLLAGDVEAAALFRADPAGFVTTFRRYHLEVPALAHTVADEARDWRAWREAALASAER